MNLNGKRVLVVGTGISGIGAAQLLAKVNAVPVLYDGNAGDDPEQKKEAIRAKVQIDCEIILGELPEEEVKKLDLAVLSPGVPLDSPIALLLKEAGILLWGEIELAYQCSKGDVLAITGTNGKTTTTSLLGEIMAAYKESVYVVGNIGNPYTEVALDMTEDTVSVAEISSFMLETIEKFHPCVSAILNITPDHLNRHHTMEEYMRVKELITANQTEEETCVLNYEDEELRRFGESLKQKVIFFSSRRKLDNGFCLEEKGDGTPDQKIVFNSPEDSFVLCTTDELNILGAHNHENVMAAAAMAYAYGVPVNVIRDAVLAFQAVEHRIEYVTEKNGVVYYNDSKGTNPDAAIKGIQAMNRPTILIGGGYDKDSSYEEWINSFDGKVRYLVLLGQTREKIAAAARSCGFESIIFVDSLEEAVRVSAEKAEPGNAVLLSPACASWGMFPNYEVRGKQFKELVRSL